MSVLTGDLGPQVKKTLPAEGFTRIVLDGFGRVNVTQADSESVVVEAAERLIDRTEARVEGTTLYLGLDEDDTLRDTGRADVCFDVTMRTVEGLSIDGAGSIQAERLCGRDVTVDINGAGKILVQEVAAESTEVNIDGSGKVEVDRLDVPRCALDIDGAGRIEIDRLSGTAFAAKLDGTGSVRAGGAVDNVRVDLDGTGKLNLSELRAAAVAVQIDGTGKVSVTATNSLDVRIDGFGKVEYHGTPSVSSHVGSFGKVVALDHP